MFKNRTDAGKQLADKLLSYKGKHALVLAIPRGGVPVAKPIADTIDGELDVVLVHKLGHPDNPEFAIGAIDEDGNRFLDDDVGQVRELLEKVARIERAQLKRLKELRAQYTPLKQRIDPRGRTVIVVDDGIATGWTMKAAVALLRRDKAKEIVVAIPVGAVDAIQELRSDARIAHVVCLMTPRSFSAVGVFYQDFSQVEDGEVARILASREPR